MDHLIGELVLQGKIREGRREGGKDGVREQVNMSG